MSDTDRPPLVAPAPAEAAAYVRDARERRAFCTLLGRCHVAYDGRTTSHAGPADRLVALKPDLTLLVHAADGPKPQNWLAADALDVDVADGALLLTATRESPTEELCVTFESIEQAAAMAADETDATVEISGTEADLKERVLADPALVEPGFRALAAERDTPAGPVDVFGRDSSGRAVAVELKATRAGPDAASQLSRYVDALRRDLHADADVRGILVAPSCTPRTRRVLARDGHEFVSLEP
ncbi:endonuclease NucS [Halarchaeum sp. CBA1220]|uniref:endonuclease NucS n=1 Tax=Halarchaeum sp. CBA1220 TaxID=1853682 RepID=UPI000F3AA208|nr:endonuclease NucS [Halarchaeum sp. CBA1220]QLC33673.1 endonuclease NucS [Halarchaeum sp. CBA1220]